MRLYAGARSRSRITSRGSRAPARACGWSSTSTRCAPRSPRCWSARGPVEGLLRLVLTRGGRRIALIEPLPRHKPLARVATIRYAPNRVLDGLKTLSYAGNMLATRLAKEGGFDEALLVTPHGRVLEGSTWSFFWVRDGALLHAAAGGPDPRLDHRASGSGRDGRVEESCTLEDLRGAEEAFIASTVREVQPIAAIDELAAARGARARHAARRARRMDQAIERELGAPV